MENSSQTVTKEKLMEALWDIDGNFVDENTVAVNIRRLRQKVEDNPSEPEYIKNIRGVGYTFAKRCIKNDKYNKKRTCNKKINIYNDDEHNSYI